MVVVVLVGVVVTLSKKPNGFVNTQRIVTKLLINIGTHRSTVIDFWIRLLQLLRTSLPGPLYIRT